MFYTEFGEEGHRVRLKMADREYPQACYCAITQSLMVDPVIDSEGNSYERDAIERWLSAGNSTSPITRNPLRRQDLRDNVAIRESIRQITAARQRPVAPVIPSSAVASSSVPTFAPSLSDSGNVEFFMSACSADSPNSMFVMLESTQPQGTARTPVNIRKLVFSKLFGSYKRPQSDIVCVVDISGSMGEFTSLNIKEFRFL